MILAKQVKQLNRQWAAAGLASLSFDEQDAQMLKLVLTPKEGDFANARVNFTIKTHNAKVVNIFCDHRVYHCNMSEYKDRALGINGGYELCYSMLDEGIEWSIDDYVSGLLWLLDNPNPDSALSPQKEYDPVERRRKVQLSLVGMMPHIPSYFQTKPSEPVLVTSKELMRWFAWSTDWWSDTRLPNDCQLEPCKDSIQTLIRQGFDFKMARFQAITVHLQSWRDASGGLVITAAERRQDPDQMGSLCFDSPPTSLLLNEKTRVLVRDVPMPTIVLFLNKWCDDFSGALQLRIARTSPRQQVSLFTVIQRLYGRQTNLVSVKRF